MEITYYPQSRPYIDTALKSLEAWMKDRKGSGVTLDLDRENNPPIHANGEGASLSLGFLKCMPGVFPKGEYIGSMRLYDRWVPFAQDRERSIGVTFYHLTAAPILKVEGRDLDTRQGTVFIIADPADIKSWKSSPEGVGFVSAMESWITARALAAPRPSLPQAGSANDPAVPQHGHG